MTGESATRIIDMEFLVRGEGRITPVGGTAGDDLLSEPPQQSVRGKPPETVFEYAARRQQPVSIRAVGLRVSHGVGNGTARPGESPIWSRCRRLRSRAREPAICGMHAVSS